MAEMTVAFARQLLKLSGMSHAQGQYTPEEWIQKTGIDPRDYPAYVRIDGAGKCHWTHNAEKVSEAYHAHSAQNRRAIGS